MGWSCVHRMHLRVWDMESRLGVKPKFRYPFFRPLMWHTATQLASGKAGKGPRQRNAAPRQSELSARL